MLLRSQDISAGPCRRITGVHIEQLTNLSQRETAFLRALYESDAPYRAVGVKPVSGKGLRRKRKKPLPFVEADTVRIYLCALRQSADRVHE